MCIALGRKTVFRGPAAHGPRCEKVFRGPVAHGPQWKNCVYSYLGAKCLAPQGHGLPQKKCSLPLKQVLAPVAPWQKTWHGRTHRHTQRPKQHFIR